MSETKVNPWSALVRPSIGEIGANRVDAKSTYGLYFAQDHAQKYMFIFTLEHPPVQQEGISLNGITVLYTQVHKSPAVVLALKDNQDWPIFLKICLDLYEVTEQERNEKKALSAFYNRLRYWQYFLKRNMENFLSKEEQIGLIGELLLLEKYVLPQYKTIEAIHFWTGADGDVQDFSIGEKRIEVKVCSSPSKNEVFISSLEQLYNKECPVYLAIVYLGQAAADAKGAVSLFTLADRISNYIKQDNISAHEAFIAKLSMRGLFLDGSYNDSFYLPSAFNCFSVREEFPRITPGDIRPGVSKAKYSINLNLCGEYEIQIEVPFKKG